jgi:2-oxoglutarate ferredoxin oxidoreductase subunit alpha
LDEECVTKDFSIVLCGSAGQGIQTVEVVLTRVLKRSGFNVYATKEYMSRVRGGQNSTEIRIGLDRVNAHVDRIDLLVALQKGSVQHLIKRLSPETIIIGEQETIGDWPNLIDVPLTRMAEEIGGKVYSNVIATGAIVGFLGADLDVLEDYLSKTFARKGDEVVGHNIEAARKGCEIGLRLVEEGKLACPIGKDPSVKDEQLINGAEAVAMGAIAGGCDFISSYPMSPSTGVLVFLAQHAKEFGIIAEQAEDEIAAMNMGIGAWYAGARAMVTTSGGGYALMIEGLSLAGMLETPMVVHLAQRPGPATGLPTRTEQADLNMALYSGHGEFPRIILAPGSIEEAFHLTAWAFNLADKHQVPVFVLTDQYLIDSYYNMPEFDLSGLDVVSHVVETTADYRRYELTEDGRSPRGVPGHGDGLVVVDSDEHDEEGHITEDLDLRTRMVDKRLSKLRGVLEDVVPFELVGPKDYRVLVVGWGSTYHAVREAIGELGRNDVALMHFKQLYPLHPDTAEHLDRADKVIIVEGNATSQFGALIKRETGFAIEDRLLSYSGMQFSVEQVVEGLSELLGEGGE